MTHPISPWLHLPKVVADAVEADARRRPQWADVQNLSGLMLLSRGWLADAIAVFEKCLTLNPEYAWAAMNLSAALALSGKKDRALSVLAPWDASHPEETAQTKAFIHLVAGERSAGREILAGRATETRPDRLRMEAALLYEDKASEASEVWQRAADGLPAPVAAELIPWDSAGVQWLGLVPGVHHLWQHAAVHLARTGLREAADHAAAIAYGVWSDKGSWVYHQGRIAAAFGEDALARQRYQEAAWISPQDPAPHIALAFRMSAEGELAAAHTALTEALRRAPRFADLHHQMGLVERALGNLEPALGSFAEALALNPQFTVCRLDHAMTLLRLQRHAEARDAMIRVLDAGWVSADLYTQLGRIEEALGSHEPAEAAYREALRLNPEEAYAHYLLGTLFKKMGKRNSAKLSWRTYLNLSSDPVRSAEVEALLELH